MNFLTVSISACNEGTNTHLSIGEPLPEFILSDFTGRTRLSTEFEGSVPGVNFCACWRGPCRSEKLAVSLLLGQDVYPQTLIFEPTGTLVHRLIDERDWKDPQAALLLADLPGISGGNG